MTVVLLILKIIGIVLLVLVLLVLSAVCLICLVPVRYRARGEITDRKPDIAVSVTWLLHFARASLHFSDGSLPFSFKVADISLMQRDFLNQEKEPEKKSSKKPEKKSRDRERTSEDKPTEERISEKKTPEKKTSEKKISDKKDFSDSVQKICDWFAAEKKQLRKWMLFLKKEETKRALSLIRSKLFCILSHCAPGHYEASVHFGMPDQPATMGQILMILSVLYPFYEEHVTITPDYEKECMDATFDFSGRIRLGVLLVCVLQVLFSKDCKLTYQRFKRIRKYGSAEEKSMAKAA